MHFGLNGKEMVVGYLGRSVFITPLLLHATNFFGPQWIQNNQGQLDVAAENVPLSGLIKEACGVCQKQCVVDMDNKQKVSYTLEKTTCEQLFAFFVENISFETVDDVLIFRQGGKNLWESYQMQYRRPSDLAEGLNKLLPGKQSVLIDDVTGVLWVPKGFYQQHASLLRELDVPLQQYTLHLSWLRLHHTFYQDLMIDQTLMVDWLLGKPVAVGLLQALDWVQGLEKAGKASLVSQLQVTVQAGKPVQTALVDLEQRPRRDKKGNLIQQDIPQEMTVNAKITALSEQIQLALELADSRFLSEKNKQAELKTVHNLTLKRDQSLLLNGFYMKRQALIKHCIPFLGQLPILDRLFCKRDKTQESSQYALVVSVV